jgi:hypothetical protein
MGGDTVGTPLRDRSAGLAHARDGPPATPSQPRVPVYAFVHPLSHTLLAQVDDAGV